MTISTTATRAQFDGNGITADFDVGFQLTLETDLVVFLTNTTSSPLQGIAPGVTDLQVLNTDYAVTLEDGGESGATVAFVDAPATGLRVTINRELPLAQQINYTPNDPFPAETHEEALDRGILIAQQLQEQLDRSPRMDRGTNPLPGLTIPATAAFQEAFLFFDANRKLTTVAATELGVTSWNGLSGVVTATTDDLPEGSANLYFTNVRAADAAPVQLDANNVFESGAAGGQQTIKGGFPNLFLLEDDNVGANARLEARDGGVYHVRSVDDDGFTNTVTRWATDLNTGTHSAESAKIENLAGPTVASDAANKGYVDGEVATVQADVDNLDTDDIPEGTGNLYYTAERARDDIGAALVGGTAISIGISDSNDTITVAFNGDTGSVPEGSNLYFTTARAENAAPVQTVAGRTGDVVVNPSDLTQEGAASGDALVWDGSQWAPGDVSIDTSNFAKLDQSNVFDPGGDGQQTFKGGIPNLVLFEDDNVGNNARIEVISNGDYNVASIDDDGNSNKVVRWTTDLGNGNHDANGGRIQNVAAPATGSDAANKNFVENWTGQDHSDKSYVLANLSSDQSLASATFEKVIFDSEVTDRNNDYNTSNGEFTAPQTGVYLIAPFVHISTDLGGESNSTLPAALRINVNSGTRLFRVAEQAVSTGGLVGLSIGSGVPLELTANDVITVEVFIEGSSPNVDQENSLTYLTIARMPL